MGGKSWKQEDAESTITTLNEAGCCGKELTLQAHENEVVLIPLTIEMQGVSSLQVDVNLSHTSLVGLAALVQAHMGIPVVHFIFGTDNLDPSSKILRHRRLGSLGIKEDSTLVAAFSWTAEAAYAKKADAAAAAAAADAAAAAAAVLTDLPPPAPAAFTHLTIQVSTVLVSTVQGASHVKVPVNPDTSLRDLALLVETRLAPFKREGKQYFAKVGHFVFADETLLPYTQQGSKSLNALGILKDSILVAFPCNDLPLPAPAATAAAALLTAPTLTLAPTPATSVSLIPLWGPDNK